MRMPTFESRLSAGDETRPRRFIDLANLFTIAALILAVTFIVLLSRDNRRLREEAAAYTGTLASPQTAQPGDLVPPFHAIDLDGQRASVLFDGDSPRLMFLFSPSCSTCLSQFPTWNRLAERARARNWQVTAVSIDDLSKTQRELREVERDFEVLIMPSMAYQRAYRVVSIPQTMLISPRGVVEWVHYGYLDGSHIEEVRARLDGEAH